MDIMTYTIIDVFIVGPRRIVCADDRHTHIIIASKHIAIAAYTRIVVARTHIVITCNLFKFGRCSGWTFPMPSICGLCSFARDPRELHQ